MKQLQKLPQKASGPDGISYALLKALPIEGVSDLYNMYRRWELDGRLPDQVRNTLVLLLPKKEDIERPISLTVGKTGFLASSNESKRALSMFRQDGQPKVHDLLKNLGLDGS